MPVARDAAAAGPFRPLHAHVRAFAEEVLHTGGFRRLRAAAAPSVLGA